MDTVTLRHGLQKRGRRVIYFYDGLAVANDGRVTVPVSEVSHVHALMYRGYNLRDDGTRIWDRNQLREYIQECATA
jgi:hypothetical protein